MPYTALHVANAAQEGSQDPAKTVSIPSLNDMADDEEVNLRKHLLLRRTFPDPPTLRRLLLSSCSTTGSTSLLHHSKIMTFPWDHLSARNASA